MKTIDELGDLRGKRVLVRSDLNVPLDGDTITDDTRVRASAPTIKALVDAGARVIVIAHLGRPRAHPTPSTAWRQSPGGSASCSARTSRSRPTRSATAPRRSVAKLADGEVALLENLRFNPGETSKDDAERGAFADELAALADVFVSDGFGVVHRKQASVYDIALRLPHAAGFLIKNEVEVLRRLTEDLARPYVVILGGSKVSDKLGVIDNLLGKADRLLIGGGMAYTFLAAQGHEVGNSLLEEDQLDTVRSYLTRAAESGVELVLPIDVVTAAEFPDLSAKQPVESAVVPADAIPADQMGLDIGPESRELFAAKVSDAETVFWNGPMGVFEHPTFAEGTRALAQALIDSDAFTVVGGGDSAAAVNILGFDEDAFGHISTGGGASLEYLEGKALPGLTVLEQ